MKIAWETNLKQVHLEKCTAIFRMTKTGKIVLRIVPRDINDETSVAGKKDLRKLARAILAEVGE